MIRTLDIILVCAMIVAATVTYQIKHNAEEKQEEVKALQAQIRHEEETIDLLEADWSLLNQPARLQRLSTAFEDQLGLKPTDPKQVATRNELPGRAADFAPLESPGNPDSTIATGSVKP